MKIVILAGGLGTRLQEETSLKPKPMVEIGGQPILLHIMNIFAAQGFKEFVIALGYKSEVIKDYFLNFHYWQNDITVNLGNNEVTYRNRLNTDWIIHLVDTGLHSETGGRIKRLAPILNNEPFMLTYGDGVADINLLALLDFHQSHGKLVTVTAVHPPARFGGLVLEENKVVRFAEKLQVGDGWINGGFFVIEPEALNYIQDDSTLWEGAAMDMLVRAGHVAAFTHYGFWQCMDTPRDMRLLESLWADGRAPWRIWN
jgi:glucose-1-phosphate cytidylyltransferase